MTYDDFVGHVQQRAHLGTPGETVRAIRATLEVLGTRLHYGTANKLAAQLPGEIGHYLEEVDTDERFDLNEFYKRVSQHETTDLPDAMHHAQAVMSVVQEAVTPGEIDKIRGQLTEDYAALFKGGD